MGTLVLISWIIIDYTSFNTGIAAVKIDFVDAIHFLVANNLCMSSSANAVRSLIVPNGKKLKTLALSAMSTSLRSRANPLAQLPNSNNSIP
jgi:hypothetical protein